MAGGVPVIALPWRRRARSGTLAIASTEDSLRYVLASETSEGGATLAAWGNELRGFQTREAFVKHLRAVLPEAQRVIAVLAPADYRILQVEAPNVPAAELAGAVRWRAMDFLEGSPHDYTLDVLATPGAAQGVGKVIAVAAHNDVVRALMLACERLGRPLSVIDVCETAQRNLLAAVLAAQPGATGAGAALVAEGRRALVIVAVDGQLQFFRRFEFDTDMVAMPTDAAQSALIGEGAGAETAARSLTQLHRSLDLWDDSHPHLPLATLRVEAGHKTEAIIDRIQADVGVETRPLALASVFKLPPGKGEPPWADTGFVPLLGALLRPDEARP
jgi:MSHA biogenesis protein MshI